MVLAAQDKSFPQAHTNVAHPFRTGGDWRPPTRFPDPKGPAPAAADGGENPGLSGPGRARLGGGTPANSFWATPPLTDAATAFLHAIVNFVNFTGFAVEEIRSRRWASVTFQGARHELAFRLEGEGAEAAAALFLSGLDARNFVLRGHLLADVSLVAEERRPGLAYIRLDALTVEER